MSSAAEPDLVLGHRLEQLAALLRSGVTPVEATRTLARAERERSAARVLRGVLAELEQGRSLGEAVGSVERLSLARQTLDHCGDETPSALERLAGYLRARGELRATARAATLYPRLLLLGLVVLLLVFSHVLAPELNRLLMDMGVGSLPPALESSLGLANWVASSTLLLLVAAGALAALVVWLRIRRPDILPRVASWIPLIGQIMRRMAVAEFFEGLALRLSAGAAPANAYADAAAAAPPGLRRRLQATCAAVRESGRLSDGLANSSGLVRPLERVLVSAAEAGDGDDGELIARAARSTREYLLLRSQQTLRLLGPIAVVVLAIVVMALVMPVSLPIFDLAGSIGN